ncbi:uncharacterized protein BDW70DRAFT_134489 [Aspergillus foveolatus]|uniref:uncharacterized protein n=1 Tax=Aspergillus foveolatus TaxID=210207 RepID=UPI003CCCADC7
MAEHGQRTTRQKRYLVGAGAARAGVAVAGAAVAVAGRHFEVEDGLVGWLDRFGLVVAG